MAEKGIGFKNFLKTDAKNKDERYA